MSVLLPGEVILLEPEKGLMNQLLMRSFYSLLLVELVHFQEQIRYCQYSAFTLQTKKAIVGNNNLKRLCPSLLCANIRVGYFL